MVLFCTREAKMSSRILGVLLSPLSVWIKKKKSNKRERRTKKEVGALFCRLALQTFKKVFATFKICHLSSQSCRERKICRTLLSRNSPSLNANAISDTLSTAFWHKKFCSDLHFSNAAENHEMQHGTGLSLYQRTEMQFHQGILKENILPHHSKVISVRANKAQEHLKWTSLQTRYEKDSHPPQNIFVSIHKFLPLWVYWTCQLMHLPDTSLSNSPVSSLGSQTLTKHDLLIAPLSY